MAAAASVRLLSTTSTLSSRSSPFPPKSTFHRHRHHLLSSPLPFLSLFQTKYFSTFLPLSNSIDHFFHSTSFLAASSAAAAYTDTDDDEATDVEDEQQQLQQQLQSAGDYSRQRPYSLQEAGRLYVGNLPYSMTSAQLAEVFGEAGTVETVEVVYDRVTERSRGFAFVTMASVEEANEAIRMFDGSQVGGRTLKVNFPEVPRGGEREVMGPRMRGSSRGFVDSPYKIYAGNLGWSLTSQGLRDAFASQKGLLGARVIYDRNTGRSRGFGFVSFASAEECQAAMEAMNGVEVEGRPMRLSPAEGKPANTYSQDSTVQEESKSSSLETSLSY